MVKSGWQSRVLGGTLCVAVLLAHDRADAQDDPRRLDAIRLAGEITLDGALDEPAWSQAPMAHNFIQNDPREGMPATFDTEVRVLYDDDALYFGVFAKDDEPSRIIVNDLKKDFNTEQQRRVPHHPRHVPRRAQRLPVRDQSCRREVGRADGRTKGARTTRTGTASGTSRRASPRPGGTRRSGFRSARCKFSAADAQIWGINFERKVRRLNEDSYWSPMPRIYDIQRVSLAGTLEGMRGVAPGQEPARQAVRAEQRQHASAAARPAAISRAGST